MFKILIPIILLTVLVLNPRITAAQEDDIVPGVSTITISDARQSAIAFVNASTSPGLEGATLELNEEGRQSTNWRSSLGFNAEFTLRNHIFDGYWGLAIVGGELKDDILLVGDQGETVNLNLRRQVVALRGSLGLSFPMNQNFKLRPYLSLVASELQTNASYQNLTDPQQNGSVNTSAWMYSTIGTIEAIYFQWYGHYKLELDVQYNLIYTDSFSEDNPILATYDWNDAIKLEAKISGATRFNTEGRPWRWQTYGNYTNFLSHNETALGYTQLIEIGAGLDWQINIKPLDWFGWQSLGIRLGVIFGEDVEGYNFGLTAE
ncbi:hypothetical protein [Kaarinaea lacus]